MVRQYKRKRPRQWRDKGKRMDAAARLRAQGMSLRQIGEALAVSPPTVMRDLRRFDELAAEKAETFQNVFQLPVTSRPAGGDLKQPDETAEAPIQILRRK
jgi:IS30 family transposase